LEAQVMMSTSVLGPRVRRSPELWLPSAPVAILLALGLGLGVLLFAVSASSPVVASVAIELRQTADLIDQHATAMTDDGQRLADHARASTGPDRDLWIGTAQHMVTDGVGLRAMARQLRASAAILGDQPTHRANASATALASQAALLRADAHAAIDHGRAMLDQATFMAALARKPESGITGSDASLMATDASRIIDAGERTLAVAARLDAGADQVRRMLGR